MLIFPWSQQTPVGGTSLETMSKSPNTEQEEEKNVSRTSKSKSHHKQRIHHHHRGHEEHHHRFKGVATGKSRQPAADAVAVQHQRQQGQAQAGFAAIGAVAAYATLRGSIKIFHHARRAMLRQILVDLAPALNNGGHSYWLDFGSLLGVHRDGDLILHDNDIDLAVLDPQWDHLHSHLSNSLPQYSVKLEYPSDNQSTTFLRVYCLLGFADVFGAVELDDKRLLVDCGHGEMNCIPTELVLPTSIIEFRGVKISVPKDLDGACKARYGHTWHVPRYMDKGADTVEGNKTYAKVFRALARVGIRL